MKHLEAGTYLIEVSFGRPCGPDVLQDALRVLGFVDVTLDQSLIMRLEPEKEEEWTSKVPSSSRYRFVANLKSELSLMDSSEVTWGFTHLVKHDPFSDLSSQMKHAYLVLPKERYEMRFLQRRIFQDKNIFRARATKALEQMGFSVEKLLCLHRDMRLPDIGAVCLWLALGKWEKGQSLIHIEDPLFFQDLMVLDGESAKVESAQAAV